MKTGTETEAKMKVSDLSEVRRTLHGAGAVRKGKELETNTFFDATDRRLQLADRGLRIRQAVDEGGKSRYVITMKGPMQQGKFKTREEIEFTASDGDAAARIFENMGYRPTLSFQKRRETWEFGDCEVVLDEVPYLGSFVEIEGKDEASISAARDALGLGNLPLISTGYISLLSRYLEERRITDREIRF